MQNYKEYKIKSIEGLINSISKSDLKYLEEVELLYQLIHIFNLGVSSREGMSWQS